MSRRIVLGANCLVSSLPCNGNDIRYERLLWKEVYIMLSLRNAEYIVIEDKHFKVLETIDFPTAVVIGLDVYLDWLMKL